MRLSARVRWRRLGAGKISVKGSPVPADTRATTVLRQVMPTLPVNRLEPGMTLTADVTSLHGQLLIGAGRLLTERHISVLKAWGVDAVAVNAAAAETPSREPALIDAARDAAARDSLHHLFRRQDFANPVVLELFEVCARRKARRAPLSRAA